MKKKILTICLLFCTLFSFSQDDKQKANKEEVVKSYGKASLEFLNNSVYYGRKDSVTTPYLSPTLGYYDKSGFYISGTAYYLLRSGQNRFDVFGLNAGYDFSKGNFYGEIAAEKLFYNNKSTNVKSEVKGDISAMAVYDFGFIETSLQPGINFGNKNDFFLSWGIDHEFSSADSVWEITPSFYLNGSTRNFYGSYYGKRRLGRNGGGPGGTISASVPDASKFKIMDYELEMDITYNVKKISLSFKPAFSIPANPAIVKVIINPLVGPTITKTITEKTENSFYFILEAAIKF